MIHANHAGSTWPRPPGVAAAMQRALTVEPTQHARLYDEAHATIAHWFGLPTPERLVPTGSCTQALSIVLGDLPWRAGDVVVTSRLEHHALVRPVQKLVHERAVVHRAMPRAPDGPIDLEAVEATLREGRVRLVAVTGASNVTGELLPIAELAALAHAHGAAFLLDSAQVAGVLPCDVRALGVDVLVFAGHKGLHGPLGVGGFWAASTVAFECPAAQCEIATDGAPRVPTAPFPGFCDTGSVNLPALVGLAAGLAWLEAQPPSVRERPVRLAAWLRQEVRDRWPERLLGGKGPHTGALSLRLEAAQLARAEAHFAARGIVVRAGQHCAPMALAALGVPQGCLRLSFGPQNHDDDAAAVLAGLEGLLAGATR